MPEERSSPRSGDLVVAVTASREAAEVSGVLHLRYVPSLNYVQVQVFDHERLHHVDPSSIVVIEEGAVSVESLESGDHLCSTPGWRRIADLDSAVSEGLVRPVERDGLSWDDLLVRTRQVLQPLVAVGWRVVEEEIERSEDECVVCLLSRASDHLSVDHYPDGWTIFWTTDDEFRQLDEEETAQLGPDWTSETLTDFYESFGWI